ncbi:MAG: hypothetical protein GSR76_01290 [Desulfurococcales archaeon]|nr:hypothetical protein [Desulfurococcales archaeon]MEB3759193.1 hypothetical protein [Desulfurococcales archaeon]
MSELTITIHSPSTIGGLTGLYEEEFITAAKMAAETLRNMHGIVAYYSIEANIGGSLVDTSAKILINGYEICDEIDYENRFRNPHLLAGYLVEEALRLFGKKKEYSPTMLIGSTNNTILSTAVETGSL